MLSLAYAHLVGGGDDVGGGDAVALDKQPLVRHALHQPAEVGRADLRHRVAHNQIAAGGVHGERHREKVLVGDPRLRYHLLGGEVDGHDHGGVRVDGQSGLRVRDALVATLQV
eukprot:2216821-Pyramimonas_sp.AAC.1